MREYFRPAFSIFFAMTIVTGVLYPLAVTGIAQSIFPEQANGSIIESGGRPTGSQLIGQVFDEPRYLWGRLSATSPVSYAASASSGSNLGPANPAFKKAAADRVEKLRAADPGNTSLIPVDLVTASGSGLDPHISPEAAALQSARIARARGIEEAKVQEAIDRCSEGRQFGLLGEPRVNVLCVNLSLDGKLFAGRY